MQRPHVSFLLASTLTGCSLVFPAADFLGEGAPKGAGGEAATASSTGSTSSEGGATSSMGGAGGASAQGGDGGASASTSTSSVGGAGTGGATVGAGGAGGAGGGSGERLGRLFALGGVRYALDVVTGESAGVTATNFADVFADGTVGPWKYGPPLVDSGTYRAQLRGDELWLFGQTDGSSGQKPALLQRASIDPAGLGEWSTSYSSGVLVQLSMPVLGDAHGYVLAVTSQNPTANSIHRVAMTPNGTTLPPADVLAPVLATPRKWSTPLVFGARLLFIGGYSAQAVPTTRSDVEVFAVDASTGDLTPEPTLFMRDGALLFQQRSPSVCADASRIYSVGGFVNSTTRHERILLSSPINGIPGDFLRIGQLPSGRSGVACAVVGDRLYVAGGVGSDGAVAATVSWAPILTDGALGDWVSVGVTPLPFARAESELLFVPDGG